MSDDTGDILKFPSRVGLVDDCRKLTVVEILRAAIEDIESGKTDPSLCYIAMAGRDEDGWIAFYSMAAGGSKLEMVGLLNEHLHRLLHKGAEIRGEGDPCA